MLSVDLQNLGNRLLWFPELSSQDPVHASTKNSGIQHVSAESTVGNANCDPASE